MILCFSGTGNSRYVADMLAERLNERLVHYPAVPHDVKSGERIVWVFPVYSWGVPPVVKQWARNIADSLAASGKNFAVMTCGDEAGNADHRWHSLMKELRLTAGDVFTVIMPNIYVTMKGFDVDPHEVAQAKLDAAPATVAKIADVIDGKAQSLKASELYVRGPWAGIKTSIIYPWFVRYAMSPRPFHSTDACVGCGLCARSCPNRNITMTDGKPLWGNNCALCLRCYHICPHTAVAYGKATRNKGRYTSCLKYLEDK